MKIKDGYLLREVAGTFVVVPVGKVDFDGMIRLNETGRFLWKHLETPTTESELADALLTEYNVDRSVAERDVAAFLAKLRDASLLAE